MYSQLLFALVALMHPASMRSTAYHETLDSSVSNRKLKTTDEDTGDFVLSLDVEVNGREDLLDSIKETHYLKAGLDQSVKDFINGDCDHDSPSFFGVDLDLLKTEEEKDSRLLYIDDLCDVTGTNLEGFDNYKCSFSAKAICKGKRKKCQERVNKRFEDIGKTKDTSSCDQDIFNIFQEKVMSLSSFSYTILPADINNLREHFQVSFKFELNNVGLKEIDTISANVNNISETEDTCLACVQQRRTLKNIYDSFNQKLDENKHICELKGINCNDQYLVTYIWLGKL